MPLPNSIIKREEFLNLFLSSDKSNFVPNLIDKRLFYIGKPLEKLKDAFDLLHRRRKDIKEALSILKPNKIFWFRSNRLNRSDVLFQNIELACIGVNFF